MRDFKTDERQVISVVCRTWCQVAPFGQLSTIDYPSHGHACHNVVRFQSNTFCRPSLSYYLVTMTQKFDPNTAQNAIEVSSEYGFHWIAISRPISRLRNSESSSAKT